MTAETLRSAAALEVLASGPQTLIQDLGRPGWAAIGVGRSGAADRTSFRRGVALVGNSPSAAALEVVLGGLKLRAHGAATVAVTGAEIGLRCSGREMPCDTALILDDGAVLTLGTARRGLRSYLSVAGGIDVEPVLGSRSTDTLAELGPPPLRPGDLLPIGSSCGPPHALSCTLPPAVQLPGAELMLRLVRGPRQQWFADPDLLVRHRWTMSPQSDRIGIRLIGANLRRRIDGELPSEGMVRGCLEVPPSGEPLLLMADHPVTGGYPVIAVVVDADLDQAAQGRPGQPVRFSWITAD